MPWEGAHSTYAIELVLFTHKVVVWGAWAQKTGAGGLQYRCSGGTVDGIHVQVYPHTLWGRLHPMAGALVQGGIARARGLKGAGG